MTWPWLDLAIECINYYSGEVGALNYLWVGRSLVLTLSSEKMGWLVLGVWLRLNLSHRWLLTLPYPYLHVMYSVLSLTHPYLLPLLPSSVTYLLTLTTAIFTLPYFTLFYSTLLTLLPTVCMYIQLYFVQLYTPTLQPQTLLTVRTPVCQHFLILRASCGWCLPCIKVTLHDWLTVQ